MPVFQGFDEGNTCWVDLASSNVGNERTRVAKPCRLPKGPSLRTALLQDWERLSP